MICKHCSAENPENAVYCQSCGKRLDGKVPCPSCGEYNSENAVYCMKCGARIDGKVICASCGKEVEGDFCIYCGTPVKKKRTRTHKDHEKAKKILELCGGIFAMTAVLCSLIFTCFIGLAEIVSAGTKSVQVNILEIWDFFGNTYKQIEIALEGLETYTPLFQVNMYLPAVFGTVFAVATLACVITFTTLASVRYAKKMMGKSEKDFGGFAAAAVFSYLAGTLLIRSLVDITVYASTSAVAVQGSVILNRATIAGVVLSMVFLAAFIGCRIATYGKALAQKVNVVNLCFSFAAIALLSVLLAMAAQPSGGHRIIEDGVRFNYRIGIEAILAELITYTTEFSEVANDYVWFRLTQALQFALITLAAISLAFIAKNLTSDKRSSGLGLAIATAAVAILYFSFAVFAEKLAQQSLSVTKTDIAPCIVAFVFAILNLGRAIAHLCVTRIVNGTAKE